MLQTFRVGHQAAAKTGIGVHFATEPTTLGFVTEWPRDHVDHTAEEYVLSVNRHGPRFNFRKVENIADQVQQVGARAVNGAREFDLLRGQIAVWIVAKLL